MGETIRGGYYRGVDGKFRNANGEVLEGTAASEAEKFASERAKTQIKAAEKETGRPAKEIQSESEERDEAEPPESEASETDPSTLGPLVPPDPKQATKAAEKSMSMPGTPGGRKESRK